MEEMNLQKATTQAWDGINSQHGYDRFPNEMLIMHTLSNIPRPTPGMKALDIGFGSIHNLGMLKSIGYDIYGIEASEVALNDAHKLAAERKLDVELRLFDTDMLLPYENGSFNLVVSMGAIHHNLNVELVKNEIKRVLKPGGHFFLSYWSPDIDELAYCKILQARPGSDYAFIAETVDPESTLYPSVRVVYPHAGLLKRDYSTHFKNVDVRQTCYNICGNKVGFYYVFGVS